jgi:hypothetical protein
VMCVAEFQLSLDAEELWFDARVGQLAFFALYSNSFGIHRFQVCTCRS